MTRSFKHGHWECWCQAFVPVPPWRNPWPAQLFSCPRTKQPRQPHLEDLEWPGVWGYGVGFVQGHGLLVEQGALTPGECELWASPRSSFSEGSLSFCGSVIANRTR